MKPLFPIVAEEKFLSQRERDQGPTGLTSVIITSYNYAHYLIETLDSVAAQTHQPLELILVDDMSSDASVAVAREWMEAHKDRFERCLLLRHEVNQGLAQTRNTAFAAARGKHVFVLDSDNAVFPRCIARHVEVMERTGAAAVYAQSELFGDVKGIGPADLWDIERLKTHNYVDAMALIARSAWEAAGGYSRFDIMGWEDYDLWLKFIELGFEAVFIPELLCRYRVHLKSMNRVESIPKKPRMILEMTMRHPWTRIMY